MTGSVTASVSGSFHEAVVEVFGTICDMYDVCPDDVPFDEPEIGRARAALDAIEGGAIAYLLDRGERDMVATAMVLSGYGRPLPEDLCTESGCTRCTSRRQQYALWKRFQPQAVPA